MRMLVIVPTRGRPEAVRELIGAVKFTVTVDYPMTEFVFGVDSDDPAKSGYLDVNSAHLLPVHWVDIGPRQGMVGTLNRLAVQASSSYDVLGFMGDDHQPRTHGWDNLVMEALRPRPGIVYGNDLLQGPNLPTAVFITARFIRALGFMAPPTFRHSYVDNVWKAWGEKLGALTYLPDVVIEHVHPLTGKVETDETYTSAWSSVGVDAAEWDRYQQSGDLDRDVARMRAVL